MIPTQEMVTYPVFAASGTKVQPDTAKYSAGFQEADVLPAEYLNYFENKSSSAITILNAGVSSLEQEVTAVVEAAGEVPTASDNTQLLKAIQYMLNQQTTQAALAAYPVGSLYWSSNSKNPGEIFGGTWKQIKDKFVLAAGDTYTAEDTGGAATVTLGTSNLPSHSHSFTPSGSVSAHSHGMNHHHYTSGTTSENGSHSHRFLVYSGSSEKISSVYSYSLCASNRGTNSSYDYAWVPSYSGGAITSNYIESNGSHTHTWGNWSGDSYTTDNSTARSNTDNATPTFTGSAGTTGSTGDGSAFSVMPPYIVKYCWERTA